MRCSECQLPPRWCICSARELVQVPLAVDVVIHQREYFRPSSTGHLIRRVVANARQHVWLRDRPTLREDVLRPDREMWILHPHGETLATFPDPHGVQLVLLDGAWRESTPMAQVAGRWGRLVNLPMAGTSRYWLRSQADGARFSTVEALLFALDRFGLKAEHQVLQRQFELHVYASLRARGHKPEALEFLRESPITHAFADFIAALDVPRPR